MAMMRGASWFTMQALYNGLHLLLEQERAKEEPDDRFLVNLIQRMNAQQLAVFITDPPVEPEPEPEIDSEEESTEQTAPLSRIERIRRWFGM